MRGGVERSARNVERARRLCVRLLLAAGCLLPAASSLSPEECVRLYHACRCERRFGEWVCEGVGPRDSGQRAPGSWQRARVSGANDA